MLFSNIEDEKETFINLVNNNNLFPKHLLTSSLLLILAVLPLKGQIHKQGSLSKIVCYIAHVKSITIFVLHLKT